MFDPKTADSLMLAYLGDSVWELLVRERLFYTVPQGNTEANRLALEYVTASSQVKALEKIMPHLTEEEEAVWRRGKNTKTNNTPKSVSRYEYRQATGLEALFGYNYLLGNHERNRELFNIAFPTEANC
ncbi:MAG: ribonuclease III [Clostridia bacterium]|nr:ribonuclease III [Clostridia bacterium]